MLNMFSTHKAWSFFCVILLLFVAGSAQALDRGPKGTIRVGIFPVEPLNFVDNQGIAQGLFPDLLKEIVKDEEWTVEFVPGSWAEGLERLQQGEIDLMPSVAYSPERAKIMDFNYESVAELWGQVFVRLEEKSITINDLHGRRVAVMRKDITGTNFVATVERLAVKCHIFEFDTHAEVFTAVRQGEVDAGIAPQHVGLRHAKNFNLVGSPIIFSPFSVFFASKKGLQHDLLSHIDAHLSSWKKDPESFYYHRLNYWIGGQNPGTKIPSWLIYATMIGFIAILAFFCFTLLLRRTVKTRTKELRESESTFRKLFEDASDAILLIDGTGVFVECNQSALDLLKMSREQFLFSPPVRISPEFQPDGRRSAEAAPAMIALAYSKGLHRFDWTCLNSQGGEFIVEVSLMPITIKGQTMLHTTWRDITERKQAEKTLLTERQYLVGIIDSLPDATFIIDTDSRVVVWNRAAEAMTGVKRKELLGKGDFAYAVPFYGVSRPILIDLLNLSEKEMETSYSSVRRAGDKIYAETFIQSLNDGKGAHLWGVAAPLYDSSGLRIGAVEVIKDISDLKKSEQTNFQLQEQLLQAQKIESIGRLAGGVAHDFNNMLGAILGHAELAQDQLDTTQPLFHNLEEIRKAARRSADITRQLLAFARKQTVAPQIIDINETVDGTLAMLRRLIGEDIHLAWLPGKNLGAIKIDPSQFDQILANLFVNARDAITDTGKVTIATGTETFDEAYCRIHAGFIPGEYVMLAVSDNGCGMDKETMAHLFEPFFTTKEMGKGTGLGLATIYGIVKQNNGFVNVYSEPGHGTTFKVYLPRHESKAVQKPQQDTKESLARGNAVILLVEDEPMILDMTRIMLENLGYQVLPAATPQEAIRQAREHVGDIHLLMTDVIMPEMNGKDLASNLLSLNPQLRRLFMSGYTANVIAHHGVLDEGVHFIQKPFSLKDLALKVSEVLEQNTSNR